MTVPNQGYTYTIPSCLAPGFYLVRHEIIALHSAWAQGEAQFYPSCHQLLVSGPGSAVPVGGENLVSFPGAYRAEEAGIFVNVWNGRFDFATLVPVVVFSPSSRGYEDDERGELTLLSGELHDSWAGGFYLSRVGRQDVGRVGTIRR